MSGEGDSIRDSLSAAFDASESAEPATVVEAPAPAEPVQEAAPVEGSEPAETQETAPQAGRDPKDGRFTAKPTAAKPPVPAAAKAPVAPPAKDGTQAAQPAARATEAPKPAAGTETKPPQSWTPLERERWKDVHPDAQKAIVRREKEVQHALEQSAQHRKVSENFQQVVNPYLGMIQAEGGDPFRAAAELFRTAAALRTAPPQHKASLVAGLVHQFAIPIEALDAALAGQAPPPGQQQAAQQFDPEALLKQAEERVMRRFQQQAGTIQQAKGQQDIAAFVASGEAEFLDDVREDMADILALAARRGVAKSLKDAYNQAVQMHPELSKVLKQREAATQATATQAATQRARAASSSVRTTPAAAPVTKDGSLRGDLLASWDNASGR